MNKNIYVIIFLNSFFCTSYSMVHQVRQLLRSSICIQSRSISSDYHHYSDSHSLPDYIKNLDKALANNDKQATFSIVCDSSTQLYHMVDKQKLSPLFDKVITLWGSNYKQHDDKRVDSIFYVLIKTGIMPSKHVFMNLIADQEIELVKTLLDSNPGMLRTYGSDPLTIADNLKDTSMSQLLKSY